MAPRHASELRARLVRTEENHYLATPPEIARTLPRRRKSCWATPRMMPLHQGGGYLGALDLRDPSTCSPDGTL
jgi:hypothetical protein